MNSSNYLINCNPILEKLSYVLMIISFFVGLIVFRKSKECEQIQRNNIDRHIQFNEFEKSFFIINRWND